MGVFGRSDARVLKEGIDGTAVICECRSHEERYSSPGEGPASALSAFGIGHIVYYLTLEVSVPGRAPYEMNGKFRVPAKAQKLSPLPFHTKPIGRGLIVPVKVDRENAEKVVIDWEQFDPKNRQTAYG
jgi:hypothetical protein